MAFSSGHEGCQIKEIPVALCIHHKVSSSGFNQA